MCRDDQDSNLTVEQSENTFNRFAVRDEILHSTNGEIVSAFDDRVHHIEDTVLAGVGNHQIDVLWLERSSVGVESEFLNLAV